jgi:hypothetical protein
MGGNVGAVLVVASWCVVAALAADGCTAAILGEQQGGLVAVVLHGQLPAWHAQPVLMVF